MRLLRIASAALAGLCIAFAAQPRAQAQQSPFGSSHPNAAALRGEIFALPVNTRSLPDFSTLRPIGTIFTTAIDVSPRRFDAGFPGVTNRFEWFGIRYSGKFRTPVPGHHAFRLVSDDGARLSVDGRVVINNDGTHPPTSLGGVANLTVGEHFIVLDYFQGPRDEIALQLFWTRPDRAEEILRVGP